MGVLWDARQRDGGCLAEAGAGMLGKASGGGSFLILATCMTHKKATTGPLQPWPQGRVLGCIAEGQEE